MAAWRWGPGGMIIDIDPGPAGSGGPLEGWRVRVGLFLRVGL